MKNFMKLTLFPLKTMICFFLLLIPMGIWLLVVSNVYSILYATPLTGEEKILIESLQVFPKKINKEQIIGYQKGRTFEIIAPEKPGGPERFFYIKTNHQTSEINEPYFHTTTQKLFRNYGTDIRKASRWERTTKCGQFTSYGVVIFLGMIILITTLCLSSYFPLLGFILSLFKPAAV